ncbi:lethal(2)neighbour of Tid protein [Bacillus rossius redtenbacheri]|uniref:lethal(2)neighbour of Tid protein n=1 Tax=Bacillus rossius redtenbacheri TaxID=93214 RepID=UPI002FDDEBAB
MAPKVKGKTETHFNIRKYWKKISGKLPRKDFFWSLIFDPNRLPLVSLCLILVEIVLNVLVIHRVKYTEIDWMAYMQEVEGVLNGTLDYKHLKGDTGPLVYPAGFVYIFGILYYITNQGRNIRLAQYIFCVFYIVMLSLVLRLYCRSKKVPPYVVILACCTSYRIHSIFVLRLFNDPVAMLLCYAAINMFMDGKWTPGSLLFSLAVSVKMNILLFSPALLLVYLTSLGVKGTVKQLTVCALLQLVLGLPFLLTNPLSYIQGAFNLGRVFLYEWTVNWRFLQENVFTNFYFHMFLLLCHFILLVCFYRLSMTYLRSYATLKEIETSAKTQMMKKKETVDMSTSSQLLLLPLFIANFIGIACSRSLHYQFYVWYFHTLPYLLWCTSFSTPVRLCILGVIEFCWNVFPSTSFSSAALHVCHAAILYGLFKIKIQGKSA